MRSYYLPPTNLYKFTYSSEFTNLCARDRSDSRVFKKHLASATEYSLTYNIEIIIKYKTTVEDFFTDEIQHYR